jgi:hypothetical protein
MIGYYIHHVGRGHLQLAHCIAGQLDQPVTALSSLTRPAGWTGDWIQLPRDDQGGTPVDPTAHGQLHWVPRYDRGLQHRMAMIGNWIRDNQPAAMVVDVSAEVTVLSRLLGVPVVTGTLPGLRRDPAHRLAHELADAILAPWPGRYHALAQPARHRDKTFFVGAVSRFDTRELLPASSGYPRQALVLEGLGGASVLSGSPADFEALTPGWEWTILGAQNWLDDPWPAICAADVVIAQCGLGSLADIASARRPLIAIPAGRPFDEQLSTAAVLRTAGLAVVAESPMPADWAGLLERASALGGDRWSAWSDRAGATRAAQVVSDVASSISVGYPA